MKTSPEKYNFAYYTVNAVKNVILYKNQIYARLRNDHIFYDLKIQSVMDKYVLSTIISKDEID